MRNKRTNKVVCEVFVCSVRLAPSLILIESRQNSPGSVYGRTERAQVPASKCDRRPVRLVAHYDIVLAPVTFPDVI